MVDLSANNHEEVAVSRKQPKKAPKVKFPVQRGAARPSINRHPQASQKQYSKRMIGVAAGR